MTDQQLYLAIGVPIIANAIGFVLLSTRVTDLRDEMNKRFDAFEKLFSENYFASKV